jgi:hypothetical protein
MIERSIGKDGTQERGERDDGGSVSGRLSRPLACHRARAGGGLANHRTAPPIGKYYCLRSVSRSATDDNATLCDVNNARTTQAFVTGYVRSFIQVASPPRPTRRLIFLLVRFKESGLYTVRPNLKLESLRENRLGHPRTARKDGQAGQT